jgi:uncharacterized protein YdeI (YjbR/CyaY-like superfamily)
MFKKGSGETSITYAEALDQALCHGWIDGQLKRGDAKSYLRKFTPRRPRSAWSRINTGHIERLTKAGLMHAAGMAAVEAAKADGRWARAYDSPKNARTPEDLLRALVKNKKAAAFYQSLDRVNLYAIAYRLQTARTPAIREKRLRQILEMMKLGKTFHPMKG